MIYLVSFLFFFSPFSLHMVYVFIYRKKQKKNSQRFCHFHFSLMYVFISFSLFLSSSHHFGVQLSHAQIVAVFLTCDFFFLFVYSTTHNSEIFLFHIRRQRLFVSFHMFYHVVCAAERAANNICACCVFLLSKLTTRMR